ncbi:MAG: methyltransferase family protein [Spirochaetota bacterium]
MRLLHYLLVLPGALFFYVIFYVTARTVLPVLPPLPLWESAEFTVDLAGYTVQFFDLVFFAAGAVIFCHGVLYLAYVSSYPDSLYRMMADNRTDPARGPYRTVRHPLYSAFMMIELGIFSSLKSVYALLFIAFLFTVQTLSAFFEEQYLLKKRYRDRYTAYTTRVYRRFFTPFLVVYTLIMALLSGGGIYMLFTGGV